MRIYIAFLLIPVMAAWLITGCSSGKDQKSSSGTFMGKDSTASPSKSYFARERERRRQYEREFKDVKRPMDQDHFKVMPWSGKHYSPRSEQLHESSRESDSSIFKF